MLRPANPGTLSASITASVLGASAHTQTVGPRRNGDVRNGAFITDQVVSPSIAEVFVEGSIEASRLVDVPVSGILLGQGREIVANKVAGLALHGPYSSVLEEQL